MDNLIKEINDIGREYISLPIFNVLVEELEELKKELNESLKLEWVEDLLNCNRDELYEIENNKNLTIDHWGNETISSYKEEIWLEFKNYKYSNGKRRHIKFKNTENYKNSYNYLKESKDLPYAIKKYGNVESIKNKISECEKNIELYKTSPHLICTIYSTESKINLDSSNELIKEIRELYGWKTKEIKNLEINCPYRKYKPNKYGGFSIICTISSIKGNGCFPSSHCKKLIEGSD